MKILTRYNVKYTYPSGKAYYKPVIAFNEDHAIDIVLKKLMEDMELTLIANIPINFEAFKD